MYEVIEEGKQHWLNLCMQALQTNQVNIKEQQIEIQTLIVNHRL